MHLQEVSQNQNDNFYQNIFQNKKIGEVDAEVLSFQNQMLKISINLNKSNIFKNQAEISGSIHLNTLKKMQNVPLKIQMTGWSSCVIDSEQKSTMSIDQKWKQVHIQNTFEDMLNQQNQKSSKYNSSAFLQENQINQNSHKFSLQTFLQGEQTIYQIDQKTNERFKTLQQKKSYIYPFLFMIPKNMPVSMNKQIFKGVHMIVQYWIYVSIQNSSQQQKKNLLKKRFKIIPQTKQHPIQILSNEVKFKCFHQNGKLQDPLQQHSFFTKYYKCFSQFCNCFKQKQQINQKKIRCSFSKYDLYHCELIVTVNQDNFLHFLVRVYLQPNQEQLNTHKQKIGNSYLSKKKQKPILIQQKTSQSKLKCQVQQKQEQMNQIKVDFAHIKMVGSIASIKDVTIFERDVQLLGINYDIAQGQMMVAIQKGYLSQKNQLFEIKFRMFVDIHFKKIQQKFLETIHQKKECIYQIKVISEKICPIPL